MSRILYDKLALMDLIFHRMNIINIVIVNFYEVVVVVVFPMII